MPANQPVNVHTKNPDGRWVWSGTYASATFEISDRGELQLWVTPGRRPLLRAIVVRDDDGRLLVRGWHPVSGHPHPSVPQVIDVEVTTATLDKP